MSLETDLVAYLKADTGAGGVNTLTGGRIYPWKASQNAAMPYLLYLLIATPRPRTADGKTSGLMRPMIQIDCIAGTKLEADTLAARVNTKLNGGRGLLNGTTRVQLAMVDDESSELEEPVDANEDAVFRRRLDVIFCAEETVPAPTFS